MSINPEIPALYVQLPRTSEHADFLYLSFKNLAPLLSKPLQSLYLRGFGESGALNDFLNRVEPWINPKTEISWEPLRLAESFSLDGRINRLVLKTSVLAAQIKDLCAVPRISLSLEIGYEDLWPEDLLPKVSHVSLYEQQKNSFSLRLYKERSARLRQAGFDAYDAFHFARPGSESLYLLNLQRATFYGGLGPGAVSFYPADDTLWLSHNYKNEKTWALHLAQGRDGTRMREELKEQDLLEIRLLQGLPTRQGIKINLIPQSLWSRITILETKKMLQRRGDSLSLDASAWLKAASVVDFLLSDVNQKPIAPA